ncbi:MAG TPA: sigma-70 family RNA polymerase sigma factor [Tepidisphaeraceae bacterium]|nr:sigma-70 family RNA polymerase sigma factor [Tepidisphaeraceae bacterium]
MTDWEGIVRNHGPTVWRTLFRLLGRRADVDECFQETFLSVLEMSRRQKITCWSALLQTVATRKAVDRLRRKYREREEATEVDAMASGMGDPLQAAMEAERAGLLQGAMVKLPAQQAQAIYLHALSGWSYQEIGQQLGLSSSAVGVAIHRGKQRLRTLLEDSLGARRRGES